MASNTSKLLSVRLSYDVLARIDEVSRTLTSVPCAPATCATRAGRGVEQPRGRLAIRELGRVRRREEGRGLAPSPLPPRAPRTGGCRVARGSRSKDVVKVFPSPAARYIAPMASTKTNKKPKKPAKPVNPAPAPSAAGTTVTYTLQSLSETLGPADKKLSAITFRGVEEEALLAEGASVDSQNILDDVPSFAGSAREIHAALMPAQVPRLLLPSGLLAILVAEAVKARRDEGQARRAKGQGRGLPSRS